MVSERSNVKEISLVGVDFPIGVVSQLKDLKGDELRNGLAGQLGISFNEGNLKHDILLDYLSFLVNLARKHSFTPEKTSALLAIGNRNHESSVNSMLTLEKSLANLKDLLLRHSIHRPPYSVGIFTLQELEAIVEYMAETYYRHYKLYQFTFVSEVRTNVLQTHPSDVVEVAGVPPSLSDAITAAEREAQLEAERKANALEQERLKQEKDCREKQAKAALKNVKEITGDLSVLIASAVEEQIKHVEVELKQQFEKREQELLDKIAQLKAK